MSRMSPSAYVPGFAEPMNLLAVESDGEPVSDDQINSWLQRDGLRYPRRPTTCNNVLRPLLATLVPDDLDYDDPFDETEVLLAVLGEDARLQAKGSNNYLPHPAYGRFTWREKHNQNPSTDACSERHSPPAPIGLPCGPLVRRLRRARRCGFRELLQ